MYRILLVDDEPLIREGMSENVPWEKYGFRLIGSCENGKQALEYLAENKIDVVLTDICMPYLDGIELSHRINQNYPQIKTIILSGFDEFEYAKKAIKYGVKEYLLKPITAMEIGETLTNLKREMDKEQDEERSISSMRVNYHKGQLLIYENVLLDIILGRKKEKESRKELQQLGMDLTATSYKVAVVELCAYTRKDRLTEEQKKESALMTFVLQNVCQEIVEKYEIAEICQGTEYKIYILFHSNKPMKMKQSVKEVCGEILYQINQVMHLDISIGVGSGTSEFKNIYKSCEEAEKALEYRYLLGTNVMIEFELLQEKKKQPHVEAIVEEIIMYTHNNLIEELGERLIELENHLKECMCDKQQVEAVLHRIFDAIYEATRKNEMQNSLKEELLRRKFIYAQYLEEAIDILCDYCIDVGRNREESGNVGEKKYAILAKEYIEKNYADCELNLQCLCSYLNISPSYFSSIFKTATGSTFMDVLIGTRMEKAKELLRVSDLKNYEIAERVGFNDPHYFSVAFKKVTGKSPTEYVKEMKKK